MAFVVTKTYVAAAAAAAADAAADEEDFETTPSRRMRGSPYVQWLGRTAASEAIAWKRQRWYAVRNPRIRVVRPCGEEIAIELNNGPYAAHTVEDLKGILSQEIGMPSRQMTLAVLYEPETTRSHHMRSGTFLSQYALEAKCAVVHIFWMRSSVEGAPYHGRFLHR